MDNFKINLMNPKSLDPVGFLSALLDARNLSSTSIPTRVTNVTVSLIDNIFSTLSLKGDSILVTDISDHFHFLNDIFSV